ncbi:MAG: methyltransferase domain-containing protein [Planctomycetes bacterium]|nr:methyltransferase domain-containing protein [Planctomycetota bacterium]
MATSWQLLTDDRDERVLFADLDTTLALPATPAGPRNRLRHVLRLVTPRGVFFLKQFDRTQWKNRWRFATTAPRARDDAAREALVTIALRDAGFGAPRPIAIGRRGAASFYLCAALPGTDLRTLLQQGACPAAQRRRIAHTLGAMLAAGFLLPDLGAEHVFLDGDQVAVLDLHNGRCTTSGPPPRRLLVRILRRCRRSVQDLGLPRQVVLRFAARLLHVAGLDAAATRAVLGRLPPWSTAARYDAAGKSAAYADRNPARTERELTLLRRVWPGRSGERVLDLPCGAGRLLPTLRQLGHDVVAADGSQAMLQELRARAAAPTPPLVLADAAAMPFAPGAVDGVVVFRFLHHLPDATARAVVTEACRTAGRFVVVSFFHPCSTHHLRRRLAGWFGRPPTRFARSLGTVRRWFADAGYSLQQHVAEAPFRRDLWLASFVRTAVVTAADRAPSP